jgi:tripartite-type tricarboxylate transporter receptor subunit TctC
MVAKAPRDGYILAGGTSALTINVNLYRKLGYDTLRDFAPITNMTEVAMVFCVNPAVAARDIRELIVLAKQRPDEAVTARRAAAPCRTSPRRCLPQWPTSGCIFPWDRAESDGPDRGQ